MAFWAKDPLHAYQVWNFTCKMDIRRPDLWFWCVKSHWNRLYSLGQGGTRRVETLFPQKNVFWNGFSWVKGTLSLLGGLPWTWKSWNSTSARIDSASPRQSPNLWRWDRWVVHTTRRVWSSFSAYCRYEVEHELVRPRGNKKIQSLELIFSLLEVWSWTFVYRSWFLGLFLHLSKP